MPDEKNRDNSFDDEFWEGELAALDSDFAETEAAVAPGDIPDGTYDAEVESTEMRRGRSSNNALLHWNLRVTKGEFEGARIDRVNVIATRQNLSWLKRDLKRCGVQLESLRELPGRCRELTGLQIRVTKRTRDDYANIFIDDLIESQNSPEAEDLLEEEDDGAREAS